MQPYFTISTAFGGLIYALLYPTSFLVLFSFFLYEGHRRKYPLTNWALIGVMACIFAIAGTKIATLNLDDWRSFLMDWQLPATTAKTSLGAIAGGLLGIFAAKKILNVRLPVIDSFALALPAALVVQRIGCLFAGCCFGLPTNGGWGLRYEGTFQVCQYHEALGWADTAGLSQAIHPVQLYLILSALVILAVLIKYRKRLKAPGSLGLLSMALIVFFRFFIEFFRDPFTNHQLGEMLGGL